MSDNINQTIGELAADMQAEATREKFTTIGSAVGMMVVPTFGPGVGYILVATVPNDQHQTNGLPATMIHVVSNHNTENVRMILQDIGQGEDPLVRQQDHLARLTIRRFLERHHIHQPETIYQTDGPQTEATEFIEELANIVGYPPRPGEATAADFDDPADLVPMDPPEIHQ